MDYPKMRRSDRALTREEALGILKRGVYGVLATADGTGIPCGTPISYVLDGEGICIHCARSGQKADNMRGRPQVCFTVVERAEAVYRDDYTTYFESAMAHGTAVEVEDPAEKTRLLRLLCEKYLPAHMDKFDEAIRKSLAATAVWRVGIDRLTGKAKR